ncbi:MAG TPA: AMP-binding protein [Desulfitobacteriaceae bacterium]|nr:AMP-binding protein [Desulfitobacteriaceae bacterium]
MNISDGLRINSWRFPKKEAVVCADKRLTFTELNARVNQLANAMLAKGFKRGDKAAVIVENRIEPLEIYNALARIGVISVPVNFRLTAKEKAYIVNNSDSIGMFVEDKFVAELESAKADIPQIRSDACFVIGDASKAPGYMAYEDLLKGQSVDEPNVDLNEEDIFYFGYTSGTTGFPKGALNTHKSTIDIVKNAMIRQSGRKNVDMSDRVFMAIMPLVHSNSIWASFITLWVGGKTVILPSGKFEPENVMKIIADEGVTTTSMVPTMITRIVETPEEIKNKYDMSKLTSIGSSSAPLLTTTKEAALKFFTKVQFSEGYGSTETGALTTLRHKDQTRKVRSVGQANPGVEIKLLDENGNEVPQGQTGQLWAKVKSAFKGYYKDEGKTAEARKGDWVTAGDMAYVDEEGFYYLVDRKGDMIISGGENVYPAEIEEVLSKHPAVAEVTVFGVPHPTWGEEVKALVILKEGAKVTEQELLDYCKASLAGFKRPKTIEFRDDFPRTATGKVLKRILKEPYWKGQERMI